MVHRRTDDNELNKDAKFECGIGWPLPDGDKYIDDGDFWHTHMITCEGCGGGPPQPLGTPLSQLSARPGEPGYAEFCRIARSWGYE